MKAIFLANYKGNIDYVYAQENIDRVASLCDIEKDKVYTEAEILANPEPFKDVEYIFSTWSMPGGGEIKLVDYLPNVKLQQQNWIGVSGQNSRSNSRHYCLC